MTDSTPSSSGKTSQLPTVLLALFTVISIATLWNPPAGRMSWLLEVLPALIGIAILIATYRRFPMTRLVYLGVFIHALILIYGGYYTYAETPFGNWAKETFHLSRNHYDRVGHLALGFFPAILIREVLLRATPLVRGGWLTFIILSIVLAIGAFWELVEWWVALIVSPDVGQAFLGSQGDPWDAQWDMLLALVGAMLSLACFSRWHNRELQRHSQ